MRDKSIGLEGKFHAEIGELVILTRSQGYGDRVSGYVRKIKNKKIKLSHTHPKNGIIYRIFSGDRWYRLDDFDEYKTIK